MRPRERVPCILISGPRINFRESHLLFLATAACELCARTLNYDLQPRAVASKLFTHNYALASQNARARAIFRSYLINGNEGRMQVAKN